MSESVARHYDKCHRRRQDHTLPVRRVHNFVKAVLVADHVAAGDRDLDLALGNGGEASKNVHARCGSVLGVDIAPAACERAAARMSDVGLVGDVVCADAFGEEGATIVRGLRSFDCVCCFFALHYAFASEASASQAFANAAAALRPGGTFLGIVADGDRLCARRERLGLRFGDRHHRVHFASATGTAFGGAYEFTFVGAVEGVTEYVVRRAQFERLAARWGLRLDTWESVSTIAERECAQRRGLWQRMQCEGIADVSTIYRAFVCKRVEASEPEKNASTMHHHRDERTTTDDQHEHRDGLEATA